MENITIVIVSKDREFSKALALSLMAVCDDFIIKTCDTKLFVSEWNAYEGEGDYTAKYDAVLWDGNEIEDTYRGNLVHLADKASQVKMDFKNQRFSIYKYCGAPAMGAAIFEIYSSLTGRNAVFVRKDKVGIFAFGSWEGGSGCRTVTLACAQELQRFRRKKILLLSLETVESTPRYFAVAPELKSVGEYLYRVLPDQSITGENSTPFIESYIVRDLYGIEAFAPSRSLNPLTALDGREMQKLIAVLVDSGRYDAILIDMGTCLTQSASAVMEMADRICFVTGSPELTKREEMYLGHVLVSTGEETMVKAVRLTNMCDGGASPPSSDKKGAAETQFVALRTTARRFERTADFEEPNQFVLEGDFGEDIRRLTGLLLKH